MGVGYEYLCGAATRQATADNYNVKVLRRYEILGDAIPGACREITDVAYSVLLTRKNAPDQRLGPFTVGYFAADDLAEKAGAHLPKLERLRTPEFRENHISVRNGENPRNEQERHHIAGSTREAYAVTTLVATHWGKGDLDGLLLRILEFHYDKPEEDIGLNDLKGLNTLIHNQFGSMNNLLTMLREKHPQLRDYDFPHIRRRLSGLLRKGYEMNAPLAF